MAEGEYTNFDASRDAWAARQERALFNRKALEEANRDRVSLAPVSESATTNSIEVILTESAHFQSTAALLRGESEDEDESIAALTEQARVALRDLEESDADPEIRTAVMPPPGGVLKWVLRFSGLEYILKSLGLPTPVMDLLNMAGETFGLEALAGKLPFIGEPRVAIYLRGNLLGVLDLSSWADLRSSMKRAVWGQVRVRMEDA